VAVSRVLLGMHFLSDVTAGAMIGSLLGYAAAAAIH
jgi:membrane-associated phospholipid phosphatase